MVYVGTYGCYENIKTKLSSTISILKENDFKVYLSFVNCFALIVLSTEVYQIIYCFSQVKRLILCRFIMSRKYIRKTSWEQDYIKESGFTAQGMREVEAGNLLLGNDSVVMIVQ